MNDITLIIPFYNSEKWLERCLDSINAQTVPFDALVFIDDGSTDKSREIVSSYFFDKEWTICENEKNCGVGYSRNVGLRAAKTDYAAFLDADDELTPNACREMRKAIEKHPETNIIQFNHWRKYEGIEQLGMKYKEDTAFIALDVMPERPLAWYAVWNKVYKLDLLKQNDIWFDSMDWGEDELFNLRAILTSGSMRCEKAATCIRHFDNKQSLNHINRDSSHIMVLMEKLKELAKTCDQVGKGIIADEIGNLQFVMNNLRRSLHE